MSAGSKTTSPKRSQIQLLIAFTVEKSSRGCRAQNKHWRREGRRIFHGFSVDDFKAITWEWALLRDWEEAKDGRRVSQKRHLRSFFKVWKRSREFDVKSKSKRTKTTIGWIETFCMLLLSMLLVSVWKVHIINTGWVMSLYRARSPRLNKDTSLLASTKTHFILFSCWTKINTILLFYTVSVTCVTPHGGRAEAL